MGDFLEMCDGYNLRIEREMQRLAWHAMNVMNVHLNKRHRVTVDQLLGKGKRAVMTPAERIAEFEKLKEQIAKVKGSR